MNDASSGAMKTIAWASSSESPEAGHWNSRHQSRLIFRRAGEAGEHSGVRRTRRHGLHADPRGSEFERRRLGDTFDRVLAADIDRGPCRAFVPVGRGDVYDRPAALSLHDARFVLDAKQRKPKASGLPEGSLACRRQR
jgi:hypothetical protein